MDIFLVFLKLLIAFPLLLLLYEKFILKKSEQKFIYSIGFGYTISHLNLLLFGSFFGLSFIEDAIGENDDILFLIVLLYMIAPFIFFRIRKVKEQKAKVLSIFLTIPMIILSALFSFLVYREIIRDIPTNGSGYYEIITYKGTKQYQRQIAYRPDFDFTYAKDKSEKSLFMYFQAPYEGYYFSILSSPSVQIKYVGVLKKGLNKFNNTDYLELPIFEGRKINEIKDIKKLNLYIDKMENNYISGWLDIDAYVYESLSYEEMSEGIKHPKKKTKIKIHFNNVKM